MDGTSTQLSNKLRQRLSEELGGWDKSLEPLAISILSASNACEFYDAERSVTAEMRSRADRMVKVLIAHRATDPEFVEPARARAHQSSKVVGVRLASNAARPTRVQLLGSSTLELDTLRLRPVLPPRPGRKRGVGRRGKGGSGFYPVLAELGITGLATPALMAEVAREVAESASVEVARASLRERGIELDHKSVLRLTYLFADRSLEYRRKEMLRVADEGPPEAGELSGRRVVISIDGGRVRIRYNPKAGRRNAKTGHRRYQAQWKEPKVMTIYVVDDKGERDKRYEVLLDGTMGDANDAVALLIGHLRLRGGHLAEHVTLVGDGAEWIWERGKKIRDALGLPAERFTEVVDYYHAVEHLNEIALLPKNWSEDERKKWMKRTEKHLHAGRVERVIEEIKALRVGRRGTAVGKALGYFKNHKDRMRYAECRENGLPMGSGAVESAVRRVVNLRMKGNSVYWLPEHAEAMLHIRAFLKAGRWDELVRATISQPVWTPPKTS